MPRRALALFDFDGTLTSSDTMFAFVWHARGPLRTIFGLLWLSPLLALHAIKIVGATRAKTALLRHFFGGERRAVLEGLGQGFIERIDALVRPAARERLEWHRAQGHDVVIVSASLDLWLAPWASARKIPLLCTEARYDGDTFTGALATPNCNGPEKAARIQAAYDLGTYEHIYAYGDSSGDKEMLSLAHETQYKPFRG